MKKILSLVYITLLSAVVFAQDSGMGNHNGNSSANYSISGTQMLLIAILLVLIVAVILLVFNTRRNR